MPDYHELSCSLIEEFLNNFRNTRQEKSSDDIKDYIETGDRSHGRTVYLDRSANKFVFLEDGCRWYHIDDEELPDSHNGVTREHRESPVARGSTVAQDEIVDAWTPYPDEGETVIHVAQGNNPYITLSSTPIGIATSSANTGEWITIEPYSMY